MCYSNENTWGSELEEEVQILMSVASMVEQNSNNLPWPAHQVYLVCVISHLSHVSHVYVMSEAFKIWHCEIKFELSAFHFVQQNNKQLKLKYQSFISHFEMQAKEVVDFVKALCVLESDLKPDRKTVELMISFLHFWLEIFSLKHLKKRENVRHIQRACFYSKLRDI